MTSTVTPASPAMTSTVTPASPAMTSTVAPAIPLPFAVLFARARRPLLPSAAHNIHTSPVTIRRERPTLDGRPTEVFSPSPHAPARPLSELNTGGFATLIPALSPFGILPSGHGGLVNSPAVSRNHPPPTKAAKGRSERTTRRSRDESTTHMSALRGSAPRCLPL